MSDIEKDLPESLDELDPDYQDTPKLTLVKLKTFWCPKHSPGSSIRHKITVYMSPEDGSIDSKHAKKRFVRCT